GQVRPPGQAPPPGQVPPPAQHPPAPGHPLAGQRAPDLDLRGNRAATLFGLLAPARFVLLNLASAATIPDAYADRLDTVTAKLAGDHPEFAGLRALLIPPDGYIAWPTPADDPPPLARWLGPPP